MKSSAPKLTPLTRRFIHLAQEIQISNPVGRALYLTNRAYNGDLWYGDRDEALLIKRLRSVKPATATRWLEHWKAGGSLKSLNYTAGQWSEELKAARARREARYQMVNR